MCFTDLGEHGVAVLSAEHTDASVSLTLVSTKLLSSLQQNTQMGHSPENWTKEGAAFPMK